MYVLDINNLKANLEKEENSVRSKIIFEEAQILTYKYQDYLKSLVEPIKTEGTLAYSWYKILNTRMDDEEIKKLIDDLPNNLKYKSCWDADNDSNNGRNIFKLYEIYEHRAYKNTYFRKGYEDLILINKETKSTKSMDCCEIMLESMKWFMINLKEKKLDEFGWNDIFTLRIIDWLFDETTYDFMKRFGRLLISEIEGTEYCKLIEPKPFYNIF